MGLSCRSERDILDLQNELDLKIMVIQNHMNGFGAKKYFTIFTGKYGNKLSVRDYENCNPEQKDFVKLLVDNRISGVITHWYCSSIGNYLDYFNETDKLAFSEKERNLIDNFIILITENDKTKIGAFHIWQNDQGLYFAIILQKISFCIEVIN